MDQRIPYNTSAPRTQERTLIQNPNHQTGGQQTSYPPPSFRSQTSQPAVHVPLADPFPRRDPFLPSTQSQRSGGYGLSSRDNVVSFPGERVSLTGGWKGTAGTAEPQSGLHHRQHSAPSHPPPPPPPPPSSTHRLNSPTQIHYPFEQGRRRSFGGGSPPGFYGGPLDPPPPPPPFIGRSMPPPSPPQQAYPTAPVSTQWAPSGPSSQSGRDLPSLTSLHRQGSSMSISSIIGVESTAPHQRDRHSPSMAALAASPRRMPTSDSRQDFGSYQRPQTPDRYPYSSGSRLLDVLNGPSTSPNGSFSSNAGSPDQSRRNLPHTQRVHDPFMTQNSLSFQSPPADARVRDQVVQDDRGVPPRPSSQPAGMLAPAREAHARSGYRTGEMQRPLFSPSFEKRRGSIDEPQTQPNVDSASSGPDYASRNGRRPIAQSLSQSDTSMPVAYDPSVSRHGHDSASMRIAGRENTFKNAKAEAVDHAPELLRSLPRGSSQYSQAQGASDVSGPECLRRQTQTHNLDRRPPPTSDPYQNEQSSEPGAAARGRSDVLLSSAPSASVPRPSVPEQQQRKQLEESDKQKPFLGLSPDTSRKPGRASPLPQAVQGAQAQLTGPGGDPTIKSEFGRMFSGLGSGLSSAPPNPGMTANGSSTPSRLSPFPQRLHDSSEFASSGGPFNVEGLKMQRTSSLPGRVRRLKDEDGAAGTESGDGRRTPGLINQRIGKRPKHAHPIHHHHHHPLGHHHHHHHHKPEDEANSGNPHHGNSSPAAFNTMKFAVSAPQQLMGASATHHHHHHHHHHPPHPSHHHHHNARANALTPTSLARKPKVIVVSQSLLEGVSNLPRRHLGSQLYDPTLSLPPSLTTPLDAKVGWRSRFTAIPLFRNGANCTFTVRVPRYYMSKEQREQICLDRNLYGTRVYTDDSDPVAAAIHSGWIRGEWAENIDATMLDLGTSGSAESKEVPEVMTEAPKAGPVHPPLDLDLHITVLILPPLESYASTVAFGLKSRSWGDNHDGMSYMIHELRWVDEGSSRGIGRTGKARRAQLRASADRMGSAAGYGNEPFARSKDAMKVTGVAA